MGISWIAKLLNCCMVYVKLKVKLKRLGITAELSFDLAKPKAHHTQHRY